MSVLIITVSLFVVGCSTFGPAIKPSESLRNKYLSTQKNVQQEVKDNVRQGQVVLGMSKADVLAAWGKPDKIFPKGIRRFKYEPQPWNEEWLWKGSFFRTFSQDCTVTFVDDKVSNIQCDSFWGKG